MNLRSAALSVSLLAPGLAQAATATTASATAGVFAAQPGAGFEVSTDTSFSAPFAVRGQLALVSRLPLLETAAEEFFPLVGLGGVVLSAPFAVGPKAGLGPALALDVVAVSTREQDCSDRGFGCRYYLYAELGGLGVAFTPALGVAWSHQDAAGLPLGLQAELQIQPTWIYDVGIPIAPRLDLAWVTASGLRVGAAAWRYGAGVEVGQRI